MDDMSDIRNRCQQLARKLEGAGLVPQAVALREMTGAQASYGGSLNGLRYVLANILERARDEGSPIAGEVDQLVRLVDEVRAKLVR